MKIANWDIDNSETPLIIAELSANHHGSKQTAIETIIAAKKAGADAIKLQTYTPDTITLDVRNKHFLLKDTIWKGKYLYDLYREAHTPWDWHKELFRVAHDNDLICFSSPFDHTAIDLLEELNAPAYKIASFEITDIPLITYAASKRKPIIISTGIGTEAEIDEALKACREQGNDQIVLLKCTSSYPAPIDKVDLRTMVDFKDRFGVKYGLSDHTLGIEVPIAAAVMGASIIEKHFILDKSIGGPDSSFSLDKKEFAQMATGVRNAAMAMGSVNYEIDTAKENSRKLRRSLFVTKPMAKGEIFTPENIKSVRPGDGLPPKYYDIVLGKRTTRSLEAGTPLSEDAIENFNSG